jgi:hypothetical protein
MLVPADRAMHALAPRHHAGRAFRDRRAPRLTGRGACRKRLDEMLGHMKERIGGKIGNQNNNAFKLRKLFAMYDIEKTGLARGPRRSRLLQTWYQHWCNCALSEQGNDDVRRRCKHT